MDNNAINGNAVQSFWLIISRNSDFNKNAVISFPDNRKRCLNNNIVPERQNIKATGLRFAQLFYAGIKIEVKIKITL